MPLHYFNWLLFSLKGRVNRRTFWLFQLFNLLVVLLAMNLFTGDAVQALRYVVEALSNPDFIPNAESEAAEQVFITTNLIMLWPNIAVEIKRWHDRDRPALFILVKFIPFIGYFWFLIEAGCLPGTRGANRYGSGANHTIDEVIDRDDDEQSGRFDA